MAQKIKINPLHDRVVVKPTEAKSKTDGGIIIPDSVKEKPQTGVVVAVGAGKPGEPMTVKVNDSVLYGKGAGMPVEVSENQYLILRESDILAVI